MNKFRIAVCFYGQPRNLEYTSTYIKKYYSNEMYDIDYFCSAKSYYEWFSDGRKIDITETTDENIIRDKIIKTYNPKAINVIPQEFDLLHDCERIQKVQLAFLDRILLKSEYEASLTLDEIIFNSRSRDRQKFTSLHRPLQLKK